MSKKKSEVLKTCRGNGEYRKEIRRRVQGNVQELKQTLKKATEGKKT